MTLGESVRGSSRRTLTECSRVAAQTLKLSLNQISGAPIGWLWNDGGLSTGANRRGTIGRAWDPPGLSGGDRGGTAQLAPEHMVQLVWA